MASLLQWQLEQDLFIATSRAIHFRSQSRNKTLFECQSADGIVNARVSRDSSGIFAVANSHVVLLCDAAREHRKYNLRRGDGEPRLLLFSPDSHILYFTTTLSPSVQAYSVSTAEMLPSQQPHPSPPNVIAISHDGTVLLSASPAPPTIYIQDRRWGGSAPVKFHPADAHAPVSCAAFQVCGGPYTNFVLGFQDGKNIMYRLLLPVPPKGRAHSLQDRMPSFQLQPVRISAISKLHKASMGGVVATEFIPRYKSRVVSIGHDGRCRLVDFEQGGRVLRTWHVAGPATCLSVIAERSIVSRGRKDGTVILGGDATEDDDTVCEGAQILIAIGMQSGKIFIFNILGLLVHEIAMDFPILVLEWVGNMSAPSVLANRVSSMSSEPPHVAQTVLAAVKEEEGEDGLGTVKKSKPAWKEGLAAQNQIPRRLDLFSDSQITVTTPTERPNFSKDSPFQDHCKPGNSRRKSMIRPRIITETFQSPAKSSTHRSDPTLATRVFPSKPAVQEPKASRQLEYTPSASQAINARHFSAFPHSHEQDFFIPPSTRCDKGRTPKLSTPRTSSPEQASPISTTSHSPSQACHNKPWQRRISLTTTPPATVEAPDTPPQPPSSSSIYSQPSNSASTHPKPQFKGMEDTERVKPTARQSLADMRSNTSTPAWLTWPSSPPPGMPNSRYRTNESDVPDSLSPTSLYSTGLLDGQSASHALSDTARAIRQMRLPSYRPLGIDQKFGNQVIWIRSDIERLQREVEELKNGVRGLLQGL